MTTMEHEEDKAARLEGEAYGLAHAAEFCQNHAHDLQLLIQTYGDGDACAMLENLRELFWAGIWKPSERVAP